MKPRLLWVDGDQTFARLAKRFFEEQGFHVELIECADECLDRIAVFEPDVLVVDPEVKCNGKTIVAWLTEEPQFAHLPRVLILDGECSSLAGFRFAAAPFEEATDRAIETIRTQSVSGVLTEATSHFKGSKRAAPGAGRLANLS